MKLENERSRCGAHVFWAAGEGPVACARVGPLCAHMLSRRRRPTRGVELRVENVSACGLLTVSARGTPASPDPHPGELRLSCSRAGCSCEEQQDKPSPAKKRRFVGFCSGLPLRADPRGHTRDSSGAPPTHSSAPHVDRCPPLSHYFLTCLFLFSVCWFFPPFLVHPSFFPCLPPPSPQFLKAQTF